ncbi:MAG: hypothetical protein ACI89U_002930, partial [Gammaproteobacteria bacterium]
MFEIVEVPLNIDWKWNRQIFGNLLARLKLIVSTEYR